MPSCLRFLTRRFGGSCEGGCNKSMIGQVITGQRGRKFTIIREIGRGGFGIVYLAEDENKVPYAVKLIAPVSDPGVRLSFQQEVQRTLGLASENLLAIV